jgi:hypothetical protein
VLADRIIREEGTHDRQIQGGGPYAELIELQSTGYLRQTRVWSNGPPG